MKQPSMDGEGREGDRPAGGVVHEGAASGPIPRTHSTQPRSSSSRHRPPGRRAHGVGAQSARRREGGPYPVADGTVVHFEVSDPGSVDPPDATTVDGIATVLVSGVSGVTTELNVIATSGDATDYVNDLSCVDAMPPGDVNCSGGVSMVDAMLIAQKVAGLITDFPCPH